MSSTRRYLTAAGLGFLGGAVWGYAKLVCADGAVRSECLVESPVGLLVKPGLVLLVLTVALVAAIDLTSFVWRRRVWLGLVSMALAAGAGIRFGYSRGRPPSFSSPAITPAYGTGSALFFGLEIGVLLWVTFGLILVFAVSRGDRRRRTTPVA